MAPVGKKSRTLFSMFKSTSAKGADTKKVANPTPSPTPKAPTTKAPPPAVRSPAAATEPISKPLPPISVTPDVATSGTDAVKTPHSPPRAILSPVPSPPAAPHHASAGTFKSFFPATLRTSTTKSAAPEMSPISPLSKAAVRPPLGTDDARVAWQPRPVMTSRLMDTHVNFMVLGESGLGKTTFIRNLTRNYEVHGEYGCDGSATSLQEFHSNPMALRTIMEPMDIPESSRRLIMTIQDMPGWGDDINTITYLRLVTEFLLELRQRDYNRLAGGRALSAASMCGQLESSVTACLYFIPPHRMKKIDLILISAISQITSVIPVIAKSDCMTETELAAYRVEVMAMLRTPSKFVGSMKSLPQLQVSVFSFGEHILRDLGVDGSLLPIAVTSSRDTEIVTDASLLAAIGVTGPVTQPVRRYKWGDCYPLNREHSDLILLQRLLLGDAVGSLYALLDDSYERYVKFCGKFEEAGRQLELLVSEYCNLSCPHMEYEHYAKAKQGLDAAKMALATLTEENRALTHRLAESERDRKHLANRLRIMN